MFVLARDNLVITVAEHLRAQAGAQRTQEMPWVCQQSSLISTSFIRCAAGVHSSGEGQNSDSSQCSGHKGGGGGNAKQPQITSWFLLMMCFPATFRWCSTKVAVLICDGELDPLTTTAV